MTHWKLKYPDDKWAATWENRGFCLCENKDADQLRGNCEADQRLRFRYTANKIPLLLKSQIASLWPSSVIDQPGLCQAWSEIPKTGFLRIRLKLFAECPQFPRSLIIKQTLIFLVQRWARLNVLFKLVRSLLKNMAVMFVYVVLMNVKYGHLIFITAAELNSWYLKMSFRQCH